MFICRSCIERGRQIDRQVGRQIDRWICARVLHHIAVRPSSSCACVYIYIYIYIHVYIVYMYICISLSLYIYIYISYCNKLQYVILSYHITLHYHYDYYQQYQQQQQQYDYYTPGVMSFPLCIHLCILFANVYTQLFCFVHLFHTYVHGVASCTCVCVCVNIKVGNEKKTTDNK